MSRSLNCVGADERNRTFVPKTQIWRLTINRHPHIMWELTHIYIITKIFIKIKNYFILRSCLFNFLIIAAFRIASLCVNIWILFSMLSLVLPIFYFSFSYCIYIITKILYFFKMDYKVVSIFFFYYFIIIYLLIIKRYVRLMSAV